MLQMYARKRVEVVIEKPALPRLLDLLEAAGVKGYTVLPALAGKGRTGTWSRDGQVGEHGTMMTLICITSEERLAQLMEDVFPLVARQLGILSVTDCQVVRGERF